MWGEGLFCELLELALTLSTMSMGWGELIPDSFPLSPELLFFLSMYVHVHTYVNAYMYEPFM